VRNLQNTSQHFICVTKLGKYRRFINTTLQAVACSLERSKKQPISSSSHCVINSFAIQTTGDRQMFVFLVFNRREKHTQLQN